MVKFLTTALVAAAAVLGSTSVQADKTPCVPQSFTDEAGALGMSQLNIIVDLAKGFLKPFLTKLDPLVITDKRLDAVPFSVLGMDFELTPIIKSLNVGGISNVSPRLVNATSSQALDIGASFPGNFSLDATVSFEIAQLNHQWWQICWTNILKPAECPPSTVDVKAGVALENFSLATNAQVAMVKCDPLAVAAGTCTDLTVQDILTAAVLQQFDVLLNRILNRMQSASLTSVTLGFDKIHKLEFNFPKSGSLLIELGKKLLSFSASELNKKGPLYNVALKTTNGLAKSLINRILEENIAPKFKNTCYDA
jgi:hypothetical protein